MQTLVIKKGSPNAGGARPIFVQLDGNLLEIMVTPYGKGNVVVASAPVPAGAWTEVGLHVSQDEAEAFINGQPQGVVELPGKKVDNDEGYTVGALPMMVDHADHFSGLMYRFQVVDGWVLGDGHVPCHGKYDGGLLSITDGSGPVPCQ